MSLLAELDILVRESGLLVSIVRSPRTMLLAKDEPDEDYNSRTPLFWAEEGSKCRPRWRRDAYKAALELLIVPRYVDFQTDS